MLNAYLFCRFTAEPLARAVEPQVLITKGTEIHKSRDLWYIPKFPGPSLCICANRKFGAPEVLMIMKGESKPHLTLSNCSWT